MKYKNLIDQVNKLGIEVVENKDRVETIPVTTRNFNTIFTRILRFRKTFTGDAEWIEFRDSKEGIYIQPSIRWFRTIGEVIKELTLIRFVLKIDGTEWEIESFYDKTQKKHVVFRNIFLI